MGKLITLILLVFVALIGNAQTVTLQPLPTADWRVAVNTDYTLTNTTVRTFILPAAKVSPTTQDFYIQLDSLSGNHTHVTLQLYGAKFSDTAYSAIGSAVTWTGTTADTTIVVSNATANRYSYYKWTLTGVGTGTTKVDTQQLKLYDN